MKTLKNNVKHRFWRGNMTWGSQMLEVGGGGVGEEILFPFSSQFSSWAGPIMEMYMYNGTCN